MQQYGPEGEVGWRKGGGSGEGGVRSGGGGEAGRGLVKMCVGGVGSAWGTLG